jgi:hypothetical protein
MKNCLLSLVASEMWSVGMLTAWLQDIQPCKCKGAGSNELGNQVFRLAEEEKK